MNSDTHHDAADDGVRTALRAAMPEPPLDGVDWIGLHGRITSAATPLLAAVPAAAAIPMARRWWQPLAGWSPRGIPLAAAASALLMVAAGAVHIGGAAPGADVALFSTVEEELAWNAAGGALPLLEELGRDGMLDLALFYEEWEQ